MWSPLPTGTEIHFKPGFVYHIIASVKTSHSRADILKIAADRGLRVDAFTEDAPSGNYRTVDAFVMAMRAGSIPWSVPSPFSIFDSSSVTEAFEAPPEAPSLPGGSPPGIPAPPAPPAAVARATFLANIIGLIGRGLERLIGP